MSDDEFLSNFHMDQSCIMQLNNLVKDDEVFLRVLGKVGTWCCGIFRKLQECSSNAEDWTHDGYFKRFS
jgi:hypothetical protein